MSKLLISESPLQVLPSLVKALGGSKYLLDAMFLQQIQFWLSNPKMGVDIDGEKFVSFTYEEWHKQFSWVEVDTLRALVARNKDKRLIHVGQYSENPMDKTNYYRINYDVLDELLNTAHPPVEEDTHPPVEGGDERTSSGGVSSTSQRINTKNDDSSNSKESIKGIEASIFAGRETTDEDIDPAKTEHNALIAFEASFGVDTEKGQLLAWYGRKPEWTKLRKDVVELYQADNNCFDKFKLWRLTPYAKGAVSLKDVQRDPKCFMASWAGFVEATSYGSSNTPIATQNKEKGFYV